MMAFICAAVAALILGNETSAGFGWVLFLSITSISYTLDSLLGDGK